MTTTEAWSRGWENNPAVRVSRQPRPGLPDPGVPMCPGTEHTLARPYSVGRRLSQLSLAGISGGSGMEFQERKEPGTWSHPAEERSQRERG